MCIICHGIPSRVMPFQGKSKVDQVAKQDNVNFVACRLWPSVTGRGPISQQRGNFPGTLGTLSSVDDSITYGRCH